MGVKNTILIVEDNIDHIEHLQDALSSKYTLFDATTNEECFNIFNKNKIDVVVLDYYLKNHFSGLDILREMNNRNIRVPVVMITAYGNEELAVEAIKIGAEDYIRKTLDNSYIDSLLDTIRNILIMRERRDDVNGVRQEVLNFFNEKRVVFIKKWHEEMKSQQERINLNISLPISESDINRLFSAFLADIQNDRAIETMLFFKKRVLLQEGEESSVVVIELLNMAFQNIARKMLRQQFPKSFDNRSLVMESISKIVEDNNLELSKEYENLIKKGLEKMRRAERASTKSILITTLQHEIRQPLSFIYNTAEMLLNNKNEVEDDSLKEVLKQAERIESLLSRLEKDSHMLAKEYSEDTKTIDIPEEKKD